MEASHHHQSRQRFLYDVAWIDAGCPSETYDPDSTAVDNTVGTYVTNYVIGAVALISFLIYAHKSIKTPTSTSVLTRQSVKNDGNDKALSIPEAALESSAKVATHNTKRSNCSLFSFPLILQQERVWSSIYFLCNGIGYILAGHSHQVFTLTTQYTSPSTDKLSWDLGLYMVLLAQIAWQVSASEMVLMVSGRRSSTLATTDPQQVNHHRHGIITTITRIFNVICLVVLTGVFFGTLQEHLILVGAYMVILAIVTSIVYGKLRIHTPCGVVASILGNLCLLAGLMVQVLLEGTCGSPGYQDCFQECPLPTNPAVFNHNAVFHILVAVGLTLQAIGWYQSRDDDATKVIATTTSTAQQNSKGDEESGMP